MARSSIRLAAGTGAVVGFLLIGGTAIPVVAADPGHSRGGDNHSGRGGNDSHRGRDGDNRRDGDRNGRDGNGRNGQGKGDRDDDWGDSGRSGERSTSRVGESSRISDDSASEVVKSNSSAARTPASTTSPNARVATIEAVPAAPNPADSDRGGGSGGAAATAGDVAAVTSPPVRVGNGRSPGILTNSRETTPSRAGAGPTYVPSPAAVPPPEPVPSPPPSEPEPMVRTVESFWAATQPTRPGGALWGLAGLILAPIAGGWLGYRQARASRAAGHLIKH